MGLSSTKQKTTSTSTATPYSPAQPYIDQGLSAANDVFQSQQGQLTGLANSALAGYNAIAPSAYTPSPFVTNAQNTAASIAGGSGASPGSSTYSSIMGGQNPALGALYGLQGGGTNGARDGYAGLATNGGGISGPMVNVAGIGSEAVSAQGIGSQNVAAQNAYAPTGSAATQQFYGDTLGGKYLNANPYIDGIAQQAGDAATKAANQRFGAAGLGAGLSTAYSDVVSRNVADANNQVRYQNYNDERGRQMTAAGQSDALYNADAARQLQASVGNADRDLSAQSTNAGNALAAAQANQGASLDASKFSAGQALTAAQANQSAGLSAQTTNAANNMAAQQANLGARLSGLAGVSGIDQQQFQNQLGAATGLGSAYAQDASTRLGAASAADAQRNAQVQQQLSALGMTGSLTDAQYAGINPALNLLNASATIPWMGVNALGGTLNTLAGRYGTQTGTGTTTSSPSLGAIFAQMGSNAASAYAGGY